MFDRNVVLTPTKAGKWQETMTEREFTRKRGTGGQLAKRIVGDEIGWRNGIVGTDVALWVYPRSSHWVCCAIGNRFRERPSNISSPVITPSGQIARTT